MYVAKSSQITSTRLFELLNKLVLRSTMVGKRGGCVQYMYVCTYVQQTYTHIGQYSVVDDRRSEAHSYVFVRPELLKIITQITSSMGTPTPHITRVCTYIHFI